MKENRYDDPLFFEKYSQMSRSRLGLAGAGEWEDLQKLLPDFAGKQVLDLGCGYGWHCAYAAEHGAAHVTGVDLSDHYLQDFPAFAEKGRTWLKPGGDFVFSVEHPIFTAYGNQDWYYDEQGNILHFPVDNYFYEGQRQAVFLGEDVVKYHRTLTTYLDTLLTGGFALRRVVEAKPPERMLDIPGMKDELRRPMMLLVAAVKL